MDLRQRRRRRRALQVDRRRRDVDEARRATVCPTGTIGRIGVAVAPSDGNRVYALIESKTGRALALRRRRRQLDDGQRRFAASTRARSTSRTSRSIRRIPIASTRSRSKSMLSTDGGKTFKSIADNVHSRLPRDLDRAERSDAHHLRRRRRLRAHARRRRELVLLREHADRPSLSRRFGQRQSVYRLRRLARQQRLVRPLELARSVGNPEQELDRHGRAATERGAFPSPTIRTGSGRIRKTARSSIYNRVTQDGWSAQPYLQTGKESWELGDEQVSFQLGIADRVRAVAQRRRQSSSAGTAATSSFKRPIADARGPRSAPTSRATSSRIRTPRAVRSPTTSRAPSIPTRFSISRARSARAARSGSEPTTGSFS